MRDDDRNSGRGSSHVYFVLHDLVGFPQVRVYDGSFAEYTAHDELPVQSPTTDYRQLTTDLLHSP
jgi:hypothetical protein